MTTDRVRAAQATRPPKGARLVRATVAAITPSLTVYLAGATTAVAGLPVPGAVYAVGDAVLAVWQEPAVGPVYPFTVPAALKSSDGTSGITYQNGASNNGGRTTVVRTDRLVGLGVVITLANALAVDTTYLTLPAGYRPTVETFFQAVIYTTMFAGFAGMSAKPDGTVVVKYASVAVGAGGQLFGSAPLPGA